MERGESPARSADTLIASVAADRPADEAALALAELASRVAVELHKLARAQAANRKGQPDWGSWAKLANAARSGVLQAATCRDAARGLPREAGDG
jgi:hypothetical protein